jgi:hypothetical protein
LTIGQIVYRLVTSARDGVWTAHAERAATGDRFGIDCTGPTEEAAAEKLTTWLAWQQAHSTALEALQQAQRSYHRALADDAFGSSPDDSVANDLRRKSLAEIEAARAHLDEVRARRPE